MMTLQEWDTDVLGRVIGDGQCVALCQDYNTRVVGGGFLSTDGGRWPGYAGSIYDNAVAGNIPGYTPQPSTALAAPGWLAVWGTSPFTPSTHIAVVRGDAGISVATITQNPGAAQHMAIPKVGLLGYLAPGNGNGATFQRAGDVFSTAQDVMSSLDTFKKFVSDSGNWQRIGLYILGALLVLSALLFIFKNDAVQAMKGITK
jgi:hypothetical protein